MNGGIQQSLIQGLGDWMLIGAGAGPKGQSIKAQPAASWALLIGVYVKGAAT